MGAIKKIIIFSIIFICLTFSVLKMFPLICDYLNYPYTISTHYFTPYNPPLPSVTFCGPKAQFINDRYYEEKFEQPLERPISAERLDEIIAILKDKSITDQFQVLYSIDDFKQLLIYSIGRTVESQEEPHNDMRLSMSEDLLCLTLFHDDNNSKTRHASFPLIFTWKLKIP